MLPSDLTAMLTFQIASKPYTVCRRPNMRRSMQSEENAPTIFIASSFLAHVRIKSVNELLKLRVYVDFYKKMIHFCKSKQGILVIFATRNIRKFYEYKIDFIHIGFCV